MSEVVQAAEGAGNDAVEGLLGYERFGAAVDNLKIGESQFQLHLSLETGLLAIAVEGGDVFLGKHDCQGNTRHAAAAADIEPALGITQVRKNAQAVEQVP
ncbi:hypothetical protein AO269_25200 [Pseudomonas putida]|nr:hypothetical protein AO269_25200 [Pseudomonas putida]